MAYIHISFEFAATSAGIHRKTCRVDTETGEIIIATIPSRQGSLERNIKFVEDGQDFESHNICRAQSFDPIGRRLAPEVVYGPSCKEPTIGFFIQQDHGLYGQEKGAFQFGTYVMSKSRDIRAGGAPNGVTIQLPESYIIENAAVAVALLAKMTEAFELATLDQERKVISRFSAQQAEEIIIDAKAEILALGQQLAIADGSNRLIAHAAIQRYQRQPSFYELSVDAVEDRSWAGYRGAMERTAAAVFADFMAGKISSSHAALITPAHRVYLNNVPTQIISPTPSTEPKPVESSAVAEQPAIVPAAVEQSSATISAVPKTTSPAAEFSSAGIEVAMNAIQASAMANLRALSALANEDGPNAAAARQTIRDIATAYVAATEDHDRK